MRRTFQDLARAAHVTDVVTRAVSGHVTEAMQRHYSTVNAEEMRQSLARVVSLARFQEAHRTSSTEVKDPAGMHAPEDKKAG